MPRRVVLFGGSHGYGLDGAARQNLAKTMDKVCRDHAPVIVTRNKSDSVVIMSLEDYEALEETAYLLRAPKNARRLIESIAELGEDRGRQRSLRA